MSLAPSMQPLKETASSGLQSYSGLQSVFDTVLPFHMVSDPNGTVQHAGPSLLKLFSNRQVIGADVFDLFKVRRPAGICDVSGLLDAEGERLTLSVPDLGRAKLKAVAVGLGQGALLIDLSLGAGVLDIVSRCNLTNKDFSPADPTLDMIYMMEVQSFVYQQHKAQSQKLQGARVLAEEEASTDALTGLANRRALESHMTRLLRRKKGKGFVLMQIDLDHFKAVNDTYGHAAGDMVLQATADKLRKRMRATDLVARLGGDEFVIIMTECETVETVRSIAGRVIDDLKQPVRFEGVTCRVGASIGATVVPAGSRRTAGDVLATADQALYTSKGSGRGMVHVL